jgi:serine/threonine protein kinase
MSGPARTVGRYVIVREIGRGGMAIVYLAQQPDLAREVALKELAAFHALDPAIAERFSREARVVGSLNHANVATVFESFEHQGTPYIAMEYLERGSLRPLVRSLSPAQMVGVLEGLLAGLAHAHARGVVHRDLKPENVLITGAGSVKIADFGIAKAYNQVWTAQYRTATGMAIGTPAYMAPEQAMGRGIGPWTDLYATGVIAYELLTGNPPFHELEEPMAVMLHHISEPIPPVGSIRPDADQRLVRWVDWMLAKTPADRPPSAVAAWDALEEIAVGLLGPMWRRQARLPAQDTAAYERPLTPAAFEATPAEVRSPPPTGAPELALPIARTASAPPPHRRSRRGRTAAVAGGVVIAAAVAAVAVLGGGGGGSGDGGGAPAAKTIELPSCLSKLLEGRRYAEVFQDADDADVGPVEDLPGRELGLVLATPELLGAMTFTYHGPPSEFYRLERFVGPDCKPIPHTFSGGGRGPNFVPYEDVLFARGSANYGVSFGAATDDPQMQASLDALPSPRLKITSATVAGDRARVTGTIAADVTDELTIVFSAEVPDADPVTIQRTREPKDGRFRLTVAVPADARTAQAPKVTITYPGDDTYAPARATAPLG